MTNLTVKAQNEELVADGGYDNIINVVKEVKARRHWELGCLPIASSIGELHQKKS